MGRLICPRASRGLDLANPAGSAIQAEQWRKSGSPVIPIPMPNFFLRNNIGKLRSVASSQSSVRRWRHGDLFLLSMMAQIRAVGEWQEKLIDVCISMGNSLVGACRGPHTRGWGPNVPRPLEIWWLHDSGQCLHIGLDPFVSYYSIGFMGLGDGGRDFNVWGFEIGCFRVSFWLFLWISSGGKVSGGGRLGLDTCLTRVARGGVGRALGTHEGCPHEAEGGRLGHSPTRAEGAGGPTRQEGDVVQGGR